MQNAQGVEWFFAATLDLLFVARITSNLPSESGRIGENEIVLHQTKCKGRGEGGDYLQTKVGA